MGLVFFCGNGVYLMKKKLMLSIAQALTLEDGCNLHLENCEYRNLRPDTIRHYRDSYVQIKKYFSAEMPLNEMTEKRYYDYILYLRNKMGSDASVHTYGRDLHTKRP